LRDVVEAGEGEGEVRASFVSRKGVDLVDDDGANFAQGLTSTCGRKHEVQRFGCGDQDVVRGAHEGLALLLGGITGAQGDGDCGPDGSVVARGPRSASL